MKCFHLLIHGDVQGVGFRSFLKREAERLDVVGWVKNREDGSVEALVQGKEHTCRTIIETARKGPEVAWIEKVIVTEKPVDTDLFTFQVIY